MGRRKDKAVEREGKGQAGVSRTGEARPPRMLPECFDCRFNVGGHRCVGANGQLDYAHIAAAYLANYRHSSAEHDGSEMPVDADGIPIPNANAWAFECVYEIAQSHPEHLLPFLVEGMDACANAGEVAYFAAGPVEDALDKHGTQLIDRIELMARRSPKVRLFLSGVWGARRVDPAVWARVEALLATSVRIDDDPRTPAHDAGGHIASPDDLTRLLAERVVVTVGAIAGLGSSGRA